MRVYVATSDIEQCRNANSVVQLAFAFTYHRIVPCGHSYGNDWKGGHRDPGVPRSDASYGLNDCGVHTTGTAQC